MRDLSQHSVVAGAESRLKLIGLLACSAGIFLAILASGSAGALHLLYPALTTLIGAILLWIWPDSYVAFVFWLWILTPLVRRLVDYRSSFVDPNPILLAPLLAIGLVIPKVIRIIGKNWCAELLPFVLVIAAVGIGFTCGVFAYPLQDVLKDCAVWSFPVFWGAWIAFSGQASRIGELAAKHFVWALLLLAVYGVYQYAATPGWDRFWLEKMAQLDDTLSFGLPEPYKIRIWSTMNGPGVFGVTMMCGLLLVLAGKGAIRIPVAILGTFSLLLSQVRVAWLGFALGLILLSLSGLRYRRTVLLLLLCCAAIMAPIAAVPEFQETIFDRLRTFTQLRDDGSLQERAEMHEALISYVATDPLGGGLGTPLRYKGYPLDTGIFIIPFIFGWTGSLLIGWALCSLLATAIRVKGRTDSTLGTRIVFICILMQIPSGEITTGVQGFFLWTSAGLLIANYRSEADSTRSVLFSSKARLRQPVLKCPVA